MPRQINVNWVLPNGQTATTVTNWIEASPVADQRLALFTFLDAIKSNLQITTQWVIETTGRELDSSTGALTGTWSDSTIRGGNGTANTGTAVPDASMLLIQLKTDHIVGRRFLQGRMFIPGANVAAVQSGNVEATRRAAITAAAQTLASSGAQLGVWHRPTNGVGGVIWAVDVASCWQEFAVQRRRRG